MNNLMELSAAVAVAVAPFAPYLDAAGKKFAEKAGEAGWAKAKSIWSLLAPQLNTDSTLQAASKLLSDDPGYQETFARALCAHLKADPDLANLLFEAVGRDRHIQELIAEKGGSVENATQEMTRPGRQTIRAKGGTIKNSTQKQ
jgi:hypothetical protein